MILTMSFNICWHVNKRFLSWLLDYITYSLLLSVQQTVVNLILKLLSLRNFVLLNQQFMPIFESNVYLNAYIFVFWGNVMHIWHCCLKLKIKYRKQEENDRKRGMQEEVKEYIHLSHCALSILNAKAEKGCDEASSAALSVDAPRDVNETLMALVTIFSSCTWHIQMSGICKPFTPHEPACWVKARWKAAAVKDWPLQLPPFLAALLHLSISHNSIVYLRRAWPSQVRSNDQYHFYFHNPAGFVVCVCLNMYFFEGCGNKICLYSQVVGSRPSLQVPIT